MQFSTQSCQNAFICGAGHGIGLHLVKNLLASNPHLNIHATYRLHSRSEQLHRLQKDYSERLTVHEVDPTSDSQFSDLSIDFVSKNIVFDLLINSVGVLHDETIAPEKSINNFNSETYLEVLKVNSIVTPLLAKNLGKVMVKDKPSAFISLSAKIGSIEDNKVGGWYSYRASKAALNMLIKTLSIEFKRKLPNCLVLAIHPGTTKTQLSAPFLQRTNYTIHDPATTAQNILEIVDGMSITKTGSFFSWDKAPIPW